MLARANECALRNAFFKKTRMSAGQIFKKTRMSVGVVYDSDENSGRAIADGVVYDSDENSGRANADDDDGMTRRLWNCTAAVRT